MTHIHAEYKVQSTLIYSPSDFILIFSYKVKVFQKNLSKLLSIESIGNQQLQQQACVKPIWRHNFINQLPVRSGSGVLSVVSASSRHLLLLTKTWWRFIRTRTSRRTSLPSWIWCALVDDVMIEKYNVYQFILRQVSGLYHDSSLGNAVTIKLVNIILMDYDDVRFTVMTSLVKSWIKIMF